MCYSFLAAYLVFVVAATRAEERPGFGATQLARLLEDRPDMQGLLPEDDVICRWMIRHFDSTHGRRIHWDGEEPISGRLIECDVNPQGDLVIRLTGSDKVTGRDKWYWAVFGLTNILPLDEYEAIIDLAKRRRVTRKRFVSMWVAHELDSRIRVMKFFRRYPLPDATLENAPAYTRNTRPSVKRIDLEAYMQHLDTLDRQHDPRTYFRQLYDSLRR